MTKTKEVNAVIEIPTNDILVLPNQYDKLIEVGFETNADLDRMERLFDLKTKHEANEARKAYHLAMAEFKKEPILISKDKENSQYKSKYTTIGNLINSVTPALGKYGLSHKWDIEQAPDGIIRVVCVSTHRLGHSDRVTMIAPPDKTGAKNAIQQIKSTITYLKSATFESLFGLASSDANVNDDGNGYTQAEKIDEKQLSQITDMLLAIDKKESDYCKFKKVKDLKDIPKSMFNACVAELKPMEAK